MENDAAIDADLSALHSCMIPKHAIYSLLLTLPSVATAAFAMKLLHNEEHRLKEASLTTTRERAGRIAETIDLAVAEVKSSLMESLAELPEANLPQELALWETSSSLVCNAFMCSPDGTLSPPAKDAGDTAVLKRDGLFPWDRAGLRPALPPGEGAGEDPALPAKLALQDLKQKSAWTAKLAGASDRPAEQFDWVYSRSADGLRLAAWYRPAPEADVRAVEVSVSSLLEDLRASFPAETYPTEALVLADESGAVVHASDPAFRPAGLPDVVMPIGGELPGWEVRAYHRWHRSPASRLFLLGSSTVVLLAAVAIGAALLLLRQSRRDHLLASQRTNFVSNVSHELKTPLTSIRMYAEMLESGRVSDPGRVAKYLGVIAAESQRLTRLVNNVLDFGRLERGVKELTPAAQDVLPVIESALESQRIALENAGLKVRREYASDDPVLAIIDLDALEAVLVNLIDNAIKYAGVGGELRVQVAAVGKTVWIRLIDLGPGVPEAQREAIFDRFHRIGEALTDRSGTGLGLSIARGLARRMQGELRCCDHDGPGACFELTLRADQR